MGAAASKAIANPELERISLSLIVQGKEIREAFALLSAEDFSSGIHQKLFTICKSLHDRNIPVDSVSVAAEAVQRKESTISTAILLELIGTPCDGQNPAAYYGMLREYTAMRQLEAVRKAMEVPKEGEVREFIEKNIAELRGVLERLTIASPLRSAEEIIVSIGPEEFVNPERSQIQFKTGFYRLDELTCGLGAKEFTIVAGRPSSGKTAFGISVAKNLVGRDTPVAFFSLEMNSRSLLERMACADAQVDLLDFRQGILNQEEKSRMYGALGNIASMPLYINDTPSLSCEQIFSHAERAVREHGVRVVFVDYLGLVRPSSDNRKQKTREREVTEIAESLRAIAKELGIAMVALCQLSRGSENRTDHRPTLSDLRDSGGLEQAADLVVFIYREWMYKKMRDDLRERAEVIIGKQRNGPVASCDLRFLPRYTVFLNPEATGATQYENHSENENV